MEYHHAAGPAAARIYYADWIKALTDSPALPMVATPETPPGPVSGLCLSNAAVRPPDQGVPLAGLHAALDTWFESHARELPWRDAGCSPWGVLVSEIMLQQTPVVRVLPVWEEWLRRWPEPADLAREPAGEAVRSWGRLGYPRRALRLHAAAVAIGDSHGGMVPATYAELLGLPGVGSYTAAAVAAFAYGRRETVVDTNIRRVHARLFTGTALPAQALTAAEMRLAGQLLPDDVGASVRWNASVMELGALVCTARAPKCGECPVRSSCTWVAAGEPPPTYTPKGQSWHGTDRQVRGAVLAVLRVADAPVPPDLLQRAPVDLGFERDGIGIPLAALHRLNSAPEQLERALAGLLADGLAEMHLGGLRLPA
jgi:A/G-specific adenine glycosylase